MNVESEFRKLKLGEKIRELRLKRADTLRQVAAASGLSIPLLSQIENNAVSPPVATLLRIAKALEVNIGFFFREEESQERAVVVRKHERKKTFRRMHLQHRDGGYSYEALAYKKNWKHMEPFLVEFEPKKEDRTNLSEPPGGGIPLSLPGAAGLSLRPQGNFAGGGGQPLLRVRRSPRLPGPAGA